MREPGWGSALRSEPHRLLFPVGAVLAWIGVLPWLLFGLRAPALYGPFQRMLGYRAFLHPIVELDGFVGCFAAGLLFTLWPRRTGASPAAGWEVAVAAIAPVASAAFGVAGRWQAAQLCSLVQLAVLVEFCARRMSRRQEPGFLWIALGLLGGFAGSVLGLVGAARGDEGFRLHELGRDLALQGLFTACAAGVARLMREDHRESDAVALAVDGVAAAAFLASFWIGSQVSVQLGYAVRTVALAAIAWPMHVSWFGPENLRRSLAHLSLWLLAFGTAWIATDPHVRRAGLHVIFLGSFSLLLTAGFFGAPLAPRRWIALSAGLFAVSMFGRVFVELDPPSFHVWMVVSSASFLGATAVWAVPGSRIGAGD